MTWEFGEQAVGIMAVMMGGWDGGGLLPALGISIPLRFTHILILTRLQWW